MGGAPSAEGGYAAKGAAPSGVPNGAAAAAKDAAAALAPPRLAPRSSARTSGDSASSFDDHGSGAGAAAATAVPSQWRLFNSVAAPPETTDPCPTNVARPPPRRKASAPPRRSLDSESLRPISEAPQTLAEWSRKSPLASVSNGGDAKAIASSGDIEAGGSGSGDGIVGRGCGGSGGSGRFERRSASSGGGSGWKQREQAAAAQRSTLAHAGRMGTQPWWIVACIIIGTTATPSAMGLLPSVFAGLSWGGGAACLAGGLALHTYCNWLLADLTTWDDVLHVSYRSLADSIWGAPGYYIVHVLQLLASLGTVVSIQLAMAFTMKDLYKAFNPRGRVTLAEWGIIAAAVHMLLSQVYLTRLRSMRNGISSAIAAAVLVVTWAVLVLASCIVDGRSINRQDAAGRAAEAQIASTDRGAGRDTTLNRATEVLSTLGTLSFALGNHLLSATLAHARPPTDRSARGAVAGSSGVITACFFAVGASGYRALGGGVNALLMLNLFPPRGGLAVAAGVVSLVVSLFAFQMYCLPAFEVLDALFMDRSRQPGSWKNAAIHAVGSCAWVVCVAFVAAMLPLFAAFTQIVGELLFVPLVFVIPLLLYLKARQPRRWVWAAHIGLSALLLLVVSLLGFATTLRQIFNKSNTYSLFANVDTPL